jgi:hypothetical protein
MDFFANFLKTLKNEKNATLVESLENGYISLFEASNVATEDEERELSNGFINKLKNVIINKIRDEITPPDKLFPTLDGLTLKVFRAAMNNPNTPTGDKSFFQTKATRIENKYRRAGMPVPKQDEVA